MTPEKETTPPTKEQIIIYLKEQIQVKKFQLELQQLNEKLATSKAEELKALSFIGNMTNPQPSSSNVPHGTIPHTVTQEDLDGNPEMVEAGLKVGDEILIDSPDKKERNLKK